MTIESFDNPDTHHVRQTECPYCDEPLSPGRNSPDHWPDCPRNSESTEHTEADQ